MAEHDEVGVDDPFESLPTYEVISITIGNGAPKVDLGGVPPYHALAILELVQDSLKECLLPPTISYGGMVIYEPYDYEFEEDDED